MDILLLIGVLVLITWLLMSKPAHYPPGPLKWPIVGNMFQMKVKGQLHPAMHILYKKYGEVVGLFLGNSPIVLISGVDAIREACMRDDMSGRPDNKLQRMFYKGKKYGIISLDGDIWKVQRRFTLQHLRDLGFGKRTLEGIAHEEIQAVFVDIDKLSGGPNNGYAEPVCFHDIVGGALVNVLWYMIAGDRYDHEDSKFQELLNCVENLLRAMTPDGGIIYAFPFLAKLFPSLSGLHKIHEHFVPLHSFILGQVELHRKTIDHEHPRDFIDIYLSEIEKQKPDLDSSFNETQLTQVCIELFAAGRDTTLNTLSFAILYMILYPETQKKAQRFIDDVVGRDRLPSLEDRNKLCYVEAAINEALRLSSIAPVSSPHAPFTSERNVSFRGYKIPKDTKILLNLYNMHHDPKLWSKPLNFEPDRFLDMNGKLIHHEALLPFGAGKRACLGETLARNNLFLFFSAILQRYNLSVPDGEPKPIVEPHGRGILAPKAFKVKVQIRI